MGIIDVPGYSKAQADARYYPVSPRVAAWHRIMDEATADSALLVNGDSTGVGTTRWPRLLANYIATQWPTWTVVWAPWDDTTKTYPTGSKVTVQSGSNGRTLTIYNQSVSGQVIAYARDNMATITSGITPDVIFWNYGHNATQVGDAYRPVHAETVIRYRNAYPKAATVSIIQNPRDQVIFASTSPTYSSTQTTFRAIYEFSVAQGLTIVDVNANFRAYPAYGSALLNSDGLHPNDATGSPRWASITWDAIKPTGARAPAPGVQLSSNRIWIPAAQFYAVDGSPTISTLSYGWQAWGMPNGADTSVACSVDIPTAWKYQNAHLLTVTTAAGAAGNQQVFSPFHQYGSTSTGIGGLVTIGTWVADASLTSGAQYIAGVTVDRLLWDRIQFSASPVALKVMRKGTNASDTFASPIHILGLMIEQAY
jgi:hypothetical protein